MLTTDLLDHDIRQAFADAAHVAIVSHIRPDGDAIGSLLGLGESLRLAGKQVQLVLQDTSGEKYAHLAGFDQIRNRLIPGFDLLVVVDCSDLTRTGEVLNGYKPDLVIDHHKTNVNFGRINYVVEDAEATSVILAKKIDAWGLTINRSVAECLLTGILADTIGFRTSNVTSDCLRIAAELVDLGANLPYLYHQTLLTRSVSEMLYWGQGLIKLQFEDGILWTELNLEDRISSGYYENDDADLINVLSSVSEISIALIFVQQSSSRVKISWRSVEGIDVSKIAFSFGGGGHAAAAGADVSGSMEEVREKVLNETRLLLMSAS